MLKNKYSDKVQGNECFTSFNDSAIQYVYHRKSPNFVGKLVIPLNRMPSLPDFEKKYKCIYEKEKSKYNGREWQNALRLPVLGKCLWNDVIFLSPLHPHYIYKEYKQLGLPVDNYSNLSRYFQIPVSKLNPASTVIWSFPGYSENPKEAEKFLTKETFKNLSIKNYMESKKLPVETISFYRSELKKNPNTRPKFTFFKIPHVMTTESITISEDIRVIHWKSPVT